MDPENPTPDPQTTPDDAPKPDSAPEQTGKQPPWGKPENFDAEKAWELIQNLRTEKGDPQKVTDLEQRLADAEKANADRMDAFAKALGLKPEDAPADPAELAKQITAEQGKTSEAEARADDATRQLAIYRLAATGKHDGNPAALLDSATFLASMKDVDPADEKAVVAAVTSALEVNPSLKATPTTPPFPGGPRFSGTRPDPGPGLPRLRDAYAQNSK